jgi:peptidoglycan/LPS O-acetylase OafA/YrhL
MAIEAAILLALVVLPDDVRHQSRLRRFLNTRALTAAGLASYSVFLWHEPLVRWLAKRGATVGGRPGFFVNVVVLGLFTAALSALTYFFVERPALSRKRRRAQISESLPSVTIRTPDVARRPS